MDNQTAENNNQLPKFKFLTLIKSGLTRKNILILLGLVVLGEILWAAGVLYKTNTSTPAPKQTVSVQSKPTQIELKSSQPSVKVGDKFIVSINISSDNLTDGVDLIISYDPKLLSLETTGEKKIPVAVTTIYNDYPLNAVELETGKITVSGISTGQDGIKPNGLFGSINFVAKAVGLTKISLEFSPGSTVDTNVIERNTGKDILEAVKDIDITITP